jgi:hypothetical protein
VAGACECGDGPSGFIKCGEFLNELKTCWLLRKDGLTEIITVFARVICAPFFIILAPEKSGCVKYADFFLWKS